MTVLTVLALAAAVLSGASPPETTTWGRPVPAVSGDVFTKAGRLELAPTAGFSIHDAFYRKTLLGGEVSIHLGETLSLAGYGGYALSSPAKVMQICGTAAAPDVCNYPTEATLEGRGAGRISVVAGLDLRWAPIYGKLSLAAESFVNFDLYFTIGPAFVGYQGPTSDPSVSSFQPGFGGRAGIGARVMFTRWFALRAAAMDLAYVERVRRGDSITTMFRQQFIIEVGPSFFFGATGSGQ